MRVAWLPFFCYVTICAQLPRLLLMNPPALNLDPLLAQAESLMQSGDWAAAETALASLPPEMLNVRALYLLGLSRFKLKRLGAAEQAFTQLLRLEPKHRDALYLLGTIQRFGGKPQAAMNTLNTLVKLAPEHLDGWLQLGHVLGELNRVPLALRCYKQVQGMAPDHPEIHEFLALTYEALGEKDLTREHYEKAVARNPENARLLSSYVGSRHNALTEPHVARLEAILADADAKPQDAMRAAYALARVREQNGHHAEAFRLYAEANAMQARLAPFDTAGYAAWCDNVLARLGEEGLALPEGGSDDDAPIFVLGMPRSGTSLVEHILASHSEVEGAGELVILREIAEVLLPKLTGKPYPEGLPALTPAQCKQLGDYYMQALRSYSGVRHVVDKMPGNYVYLPLIRAILPRAKIVHTARDAVDTCWSIYRHYFPLGHLYKTDFASLAATHKAYQRFMTAWERALPGSFHTVEYERLIAAPEPTIRRLVAACGLEWEDTCLNFEKTERAVNTASKNQVREGIYTKAIKSWAPVEQELQPLVEALAD